MSFFGITGLVLVLSFCFLFPLVFLGKRKRVVKYGRGVRVKRSDVAQETFNSFAAGEFAVTDADLHEAFKEDE